MPARRFPPPWSVEELDACFVVKDGTEQKLAYVYFEDEPGQRSQCRFDFAAPRTPAVSAEVIVAGERVGGGLPSSD
jgi:hypothetical protein